MQSAPCLEGEPQGYVDWLERGAGLIVSAIRCLDIFNVYTKISAARFHVIYTIRMDIFHDAKKNRANVRCDGARRIISLRKANSREVT